MPISVPEGEDEAASSWSKDRLEAAVQDTRDAKSQTRPAELTVAVRIPNAVTDPKRSLVYPALLTCPMLKVNVMA